MKLIASNTCAPRVVGIFYILYISVVNSFDLTSSDSFAKFQKWNPCQNGSIQLEFKTSSVHALVLYTDDGGRSDYIELKLLSGRLDLRLKFGNSPMRIINLGHNLNDNQWHKVLLERRGKDVILSVDSHSQTQTYHGFDQTFGDYSTNRGVFIGGLPKEFEDRTLSWSPVYFEPRFKGSVRNILFSDCGGPMFRAEWSDYLGIVSGKDHCVGNDPCLHGGICLTQDVGVVCNCSYTDYEGQFCGKSKFLFNN